MCIPGGRGGQFKWPTLTELHQKLFNKGFGEAHDAAYDVDATARCFFELCRLRVIQRPELTAPDAIVYEAPELEAANFQAPAPADSPPPNLESKTGGKPGGKASALSDDVPFVHLHTHSKFSILQAVSNVSELVETAVDHGANALAISDHGNMMGAFQFVRAANKAGIKAIVGAELNVCRDHTDRSTKDDGYPTVMLAKNKKGYHHLTKLSSKAYTDGFYYVPRIDKTLVEEFKSDIIVTTGGLFGEVPSLILNVGEATGRGSICVVERHLGPQLLCGDQPPWLGGRAGRK